MITDSLIVLKEHLGGSIKGNALVTACISCGKKNHFFIYANADGLNSLCYKCGFKLHNYSQYLGKQSFEDRAHSTSVFVVRKMIVTEDLPSVYTLDDFEFTPALEYLSTRGISKQTIKKYNLSLGREGIWKNRIVFYVLDDYGGVLLVGGRAINNKAELRYYYPSESSKSSYLFNLEHIDESFNFAVVVEGPMDVICSRVSSAVALMGSTMSNTQKKLLFSRFKKFVVWLDKDAWKKANVIANDLLEGGSVRIVRQQCGSDPGDCPDPVRELANATEYTKSDYIKFKMNGGRR